MTYKIRQKVRVKENFWELPNPTRFGAPEEKKKLAGKVLEVALVYPDGDVRTKAGTLGKGIDTVWMWHPSWLEPVEKTLETLEKGDIVVNSDGYYRKVLSVREEGELYDVSFDSTDLQSDRLKGAAGSYSLFDLQKYSYKPYIPEKNDEVEMTVAEMRDALSKSLGKTVKVVE